MLRVRAFVVSPLYSNCYVLDAGDHQEAVIVDPGDVNLDEVFAYIESHRLQVRAVWNTHAHLDHIAGVDVVRRRFGVSAFVHAADLPLWEGYPDAANQWLGIRPDPLAPPDAYWAEGDEVRVGGYSFRVWHTPGHSPGSVCLVGESVALTGDTLFAGSIGRVDLPLSDPEAMCASLRKICTWPAALTLYPGHMQSTTMAAERAANPFLRHLPD